MLKLMKWNSINFIKKYGICYILFTITLLLALVFPASHNYSETVAIFCSIIGGLLYGLGIIFLIELTLNWLNTKTAILENSIPIKAWKILLSKIMFLIFIQIINYALMILLDLMLNKFETENVQYLIINFNPMQALVIYIFVIGIIILADLLAKTITKKYHGFLATMLFILISIILIYVFAITLKITGSADVTFYGLSISVKNENNTIIRHIIYLFSTIGFFIINSKLVEKKIDIF